MRRQDITFEDKDDALRADVRTLGTLVGDLLREQGGESLYEFVETARLLAIRRREGNEDPHETLEDFFRELDLACGIEVIRAFSTYFQVTNTAEKVHRIRRRREYLRRAGQYQPGSLEETLVKLKAAGFGIDAVQDLLNAMCVEPVFTAHPTEPTRRTVLRKE